MKKILLAEDDPAYNKLLTEYLSSVGYTVISAHNGVEAFKKYLREKPQVVITDILMPEEDGIGLLIKIKKDLPCKTVVYSGGGHSEAIDYLYMAKQLGAEKILRKPFELQDLADAVAELMD